MFQFWDTAFKTGQQNDYSVCCTMTTTPNGYAVLDVWRDRVEYPDLLRAMQSQAKEHNPSAIFVEDAASGQSVVQSLRRETRLPVLPVKPIGDKVGAEGEQGDGHSGGPQCDSAEDGPVASGFP